MNVILWSVITVEMAADRLDCAQLMRTCIRKHELDNWAAGAVAVLTKVRRPDRQLGWSGDLVSRLIRGKFWASEQRLYGVVDLLSQLSIQEGVRQDFDPAQ